MIFMVTAAVIATRIMTEALLSLHGVRLISLGRAYAYENDWWRGWRDSHRQSRSKKELREDREGYNDAKHELRRDRR